MILGVGVVFVVEDDVGVEFVVEIGNFEVGD